MPVTSDPSPFTSVTASPMESHDAEDLPIELKVPLPSSSTCSDQEEEGVKNAGDFTRNLRGAQEEAVHSSQFDGDPTGSTQEGLMENIKLEQPLDLPSVTLAELTRLADLETCEKHRASSAEIRLERLKTACGLERRLINTFSIAYGNMIDQYKTDDQAGFAGLYEACEQLKSSCDTAHQSLRELDLESGASTTLATGMQALSSQEQERILEFLNQVRTDPRFLSNRISRLSSTELTALTSSYHPAGIDFSILQNHSHGKSQFFSRDSQMMKLSRRMDNLHWFHNRDPFFALLYGVFDSSAISGSPEYARRLHVWSATCAQTMVEGFAGSRPGSDELAIASLDAFANFQKWSLKSKMEVYLMSILAKGVSLLEQSTSQPVNFKEPLETHNAKTALAETDFFEDALSDLFDLLATDDMKRAVPASALTFAHAVLDGIEDPKLKIRAQQFIVIRWYFATYLSSIIVYPEVRGIMMTQHVGETARRSILQKLVVKMQERVFDVILPWNNNVLVNPVLRDKITTIFQLFAPPSLSKEDGFYSGFPSEDDEASSRFLMLSSLDIVGMIQTLCPDHAHVQGPVDQASAVPLSDRPSTAGSSTLVAGSSDLESVLIGSTVKPTSRDPSLDDKMATGSEQETSNDASQGKLKSQATLKEEPTADVEQQLRAICQKLKDTSTWNPGKLPGVSSTMWTFIFYSENAPTLSMKPGENKASNSSTPGDVVVSDYGRGLDDQDESETYRKLKAAVVSLLHQGDQPNGPVVDSLRGLEDTGKQDTSLTLEKLMEAVLAQAHSSLDFRSAHDWWNNLQMYRRFMAHQPIQAIQSLLRNISKELQDTAETAARRVKYCDAQCRTLRRLHNSNKSTLTGMEQLRNALRIKMWYVSDVRHSATYEEALYVTRALRTMVSSRKAKPAGGLSSWARQRLRGSNVHDRAEAQTLEAMVASKEHGGICKLADEQVAVTSRWLTRNSIENFCKGEERIHRFCYEIQRSVGKIAGASLLESPVLWSSNLFKRERASFSVQKARVTGFDSPVRSTYPVPPPSLAGRLHTPVLSMPPPTSTAGLGPSPRSPLNTFGGFWNPAQPLRQPPGLGLHGSQPVLPPTPTSPPSSWSNNPYGFASPSYASTTPLSPSAIPSPTHSRGNSEGEISPARMVFAEETKKKLCSLLVSDLGYLLWNCGSETDTWVNDHVEEINHGTGKHHVPIQSLQPDFSANDGSKRIPDADHRDFASAGDPFPYSEAYSALLGRISLTADPHLKLQLFYELEDLIVKSIPTTLSTVSGELGVSRSARHHGDLSLRSRSVPRTKATSLEEVIANCTERRAGTLKSTAPEHPSILSMFDPSPAEPSIPGADEIVNAFYSIFQDPKLRPQTLFRDLQYIAAFVPAETLDKTAQGKAFWDAGLAALALKEDLCDSMIDHANTITAYHIPPNSSTTPGPAADNTLASTTLRDAANSWLVTAKEGSPVAARELGLFYLTHPELLPRVTMPFSKAKDVFRAVLANEHSRSQGDKDRGALDPYTFAVVFHWMDIAANGGDKDAKDFLKMNGELSAGR